jgi:hypothetical protein
MKIVLPVFVFQYGNKETDRQIQVAQQYGSEGETLFLRNPIKLVYGVVAVMKSGPSLYSGTSISRNSWETKKYSSYGNTFFLLIFQFNLHQAHIL